MVMGNVLNGRNEIEAKGLKKEIFCYSRDSFVGFWELIFFVFSKDF